jgi:hypothetical protein
MKPKTRNQKNKIVVFTESAERDDPSDELRPHYDFDYSKARPNRFAGRVKYTRGGRRAGAGRKPSAEPLIAKRVYLYPRHVKILERMDSSMSAAIRKLVDAAG